MSNKTSIEGLSALLHTLMLIPQHRWITVRELQQQLIVFDIHRTTRSIKRYLDDVIVKVFDVECDSMSMPHVYRKSSEQLLKLNKQEILYWQLTLKYLQPILPGALDNNVQSIPSVHASLPYPTLNQSETSDWLNKVHVALPRIRPWDDKQHHVLKAIHTALLQSRMLKISSTILQKHNQTVEPLGLSFQSEALLLIFRVSDQQPIEIITLQSIENADVSTFTFTYPRDFNLEHFITINNRSIGTSEFTPSQKDQ